MPWTCNDKTFAYIGLAQEIGKRDNSVVMNIAGYMRDNLKRLDKFQIANASKKHKVGLIHNTI